MPENILKKLQKTRFVSESYVLIREIKTHLDINGFYPLLKIKIYLTDVHKNLPYHYEVNAHVHGPLQAAPYYPSRTNFETEELAVTAAISDFTAFIANAMNEGHKPSEKWFVPNTDF
ncbi:MAG: hypothetical protein CFE38_19880 [Comamonadaceae bacterium PBBC1]|nr:MAG: hypothetical protein CFE38_19880 [Comamonadaceae bacterium PBBC1]